MSKRSTDQTMSRSSTASINEAILVSYSNIRQSGYVQGSTGDHHCFTSADASSMEIRDDYPYPPLPAIADVSCSTQSKISNESTVTGVYLYQATETSDRARFRYENPVTRVLMALSVLILITVRDASFAPPDTERIESIPTTSSQTRPRKVQPSGRHLLWRQRGLPKSNAATLRCPISARRSRTASPLV